MMVAVSGGGSGWGWRAGGGKEPTHLACWALELLSNKWISTGYNLVVCRSYEVTKNLTQESVNYVCVHWVKNLPSLSVQTNLFGN